MGFKTAAGAVIARKFISHYFLFVCMQCTSPNRHMEINYIKGVSAIKILNRISTLCGPQNNKTKILCRLNKRIPQFLTPIDFLSNSVGRRQTSLRCINFTSFKLLHIWPWLRKNHAPFAENILAVLQYVKGSLLRNNIWN